jgi:hypothetical protein
MEDNIKYVLEKSDKITDGIERKITVLLDEARCRLVDGYNWLQIGSNVGFVRCIEPSDSKMARSILSKLPTIECSVTSPLISEQE